MTVAVAEEWVERPLRDFVAEARVLLALLLVAAARERPLGLVARLRESAVRRATEWMREHS